MLQILAQDLENLRHRDQHRNPPRANLPDDFFRIEPTHENHYAGQHRRDEGGHGLAEHVAERQKIQKADGGERAGVIAILEDFTFHRNNIGQNVAVRNDDAFGFGGGAGSEDDFGGLVFFMAAGRRMAG